MRFLLINNHCISDPTAGVTQSLRTIMEWLSDAGHECRILTTSRFESRVTFTIDQHLAQQGVEGPPGPVVHYAVRHVPVTLLRTRHHDEQRPDKKEAVRYLALFTELL